MLKVIWLKRIVPNPKRIPKLRKRSISEIPVTISAFSIGILVIPIRTALVRLCIPFIPTQAAVPIMVAIKEETKAIISVVYNASIISLFWNNSIYHLKVKPPHFARVLLALKESTISVAIGAYKNIKIKAT